jgi:hypothetical protein
LVGDMVHNYRDKKVVGVFVRFSCAASSTILVSAGVSKVPWKVSYSGFPSYPA